MGEQLLEAWGRLWEGSSRCSAPAPSTAMASRAVFCGPLAEAWGLVPRGCAGVQPWSEGSPGSLPPESRV